MACAGDEIIYVGDFGTKFTIQVVSGGVPQDVSDATSKTITLHRPSPFTDVKVKTLAFETDGTDGLLSYITADGDLDAAGDWVACPTVEGPSYRRTGRFVITVSECL